MSTSQACLVRCIGTGLLHWHVWIVSKWNIQNFYFTQKFCVSLRQQTLTTLSPSANVSKTYCFKHWMKLMLLLCLAVEIVCFLPKRTFSQVCLSWELCFPHLFTWSECFAIAGTTQNKAHHGCCWTNCWTSHCCSLQSPPPPLPPQQELPVLPPPPSPPPSPGGKGKAKKLLHGNIVHGCDKQKTAKAIFLCPEHQKCPCENFANNHCSL